MRALVVSFFISAMFLSSVRILRWQHFSHLLTFLTLLLVLPIASARATIRVAPADLLTNKDSANLPSTHHHVQLNSSRVNAGDLLMWYCTTSPSWNTSSFYPEDCQGALDWLYYDEVLSSGPSSGEFLAHDADPTTDAKVQKTPRKYTFSMLPPVRLHISLEVDIRSLH